jgi:hypothetical protein
MVSKRRQTPQEQAKPAAVAGQDSAKEKGVMLTRVPVLRNQGKPADSGQGVPLAGKAPVSRRQETPLRAKPSSDVAEKVRRTREVTILTMELTEEGQGRLVGLDKKGLPAREERISTGNRSS